MLQVLGLLLLFSGAVFSEPNYITFPSDIQWNTRSSDHFQIIFKEGRADFAKRALVAAEKAHKLLEPIFPKGPELTYIVLADFQDSLNGYAICFPFPHMVLFVSPPDPGGQLAPLDDWLESLVLHEYVHIRHIYPASGLWSVMHAIFGSWVVPNGLMPTHLHEGIATHIETELTKGGRGRGAAFHMYRNKAIESGDWGGSFVPLDLLDGSYSRWPHSASAYFFGQQLYKELWARKGPAGIKALTESYSSNWPYFLNTPLEEIYGVDYPTLWNEIFQKTKNEGLAEIQAAKQAGLSPVKYLTTSRFAKQDLTLSPDGKKLAVRWSAPETNHRILIYDLEKKRISNSLERDPGATESFCWVQIAGKDWFLYPSTKKSKGHSIDRLEAFSPQTEESIDLGFPHLKHIACNTHGSKLIAYQDEGHGGVLTELAWDGTQSPPKRIKEWPTPIGTWVSGAIPGTPSYFLLRHHTTTSLYEWTDSPKPLWEIPSHAFYLKSLKPGELSLVSSTSGRDEVWRLAISQGTLQKQIALTGGVNAFAPLNENTFYISSYEHGGFDLAEAKTVSGQTLQLKPASLVIPEKETPTKISEPEDYSPWTTLLPKAWVPMMLFVPSGLQVGAWIPGFDLSQKHLYDLIGGYDTRGLPYASVTYTHRFAGSYSWDANVNYSPSYLASTQSFFKRWGGSLGLGAVIDGFPPTIRVGAIFKRIESSGLGPAKQSVGAEIGLSYRTAFPNRPWLTSLADGVKVFINHAQFFKGVGSDDSYFSSVAGIDGYLESAWPRSTVWYLGSRVGYTEGTAFYNSYFEAGGELLFSQGRGTFLNRGYQLGYFVGRRVWNSNLEFRFPISDIERGWAYKPFFLNLIHGALVADVTTIDFGPQSIRPQELFKVFYFSAGFELKSDWRFFSYLPGQIRLGAYRGLSAGGEDFNFTMGVEASL